MLFFFLVAQYPFFGVDNIVAICFVVLDFVVSIGHVVRIRSEPAISIAILRLR